MKRSKKNVFVQVLKQGLRYFSWLIAIILFTWLFKAWVFSIYYIPSSSMAPALQPGDYVLVAKYPYNLRTPQYYPLTDVPFPFYSMPGFGEVKRGDIMVFDMPLFPAELHPSEKDNYIKRCKGLPGDTIAVYSDHYVLRKGEKTNSLRNSDAIVYPIPAKGIHIHLADSTKDFWEPVLLRDGNTVQCDSAGGVWVNGTERNQYLVRQNYYFVAGDNINHSADSRYWGLVPKQNLIGRAELRLWPWPPKWL